MRLEIEPLTRLSADPITIGISEGVKPETI
jgi:hypothetical protein